ncbi:MAG: radical SAM protein [bacterium]|nr:radical SAM protein [bacterium]
MNVNEVTAKSILRKMKRIDSWFIAAYGMNLYRGCTHDCTYCDGRAEKYRVEGDFGSEVTVKVNALELLRRELDPKRKRKPFRKGYLFLGGGVGDSYQPIEEKYKLTRQVLELLVEKDFPVHILTKSHLVLRDIDLLKKINEKTRVIVSFSLSSARDDISERFELGASSPSQRLEAARQLKKAGITVGVFLLPVIPFITDTARIMADTAASIQKAGADFLMFGGMTLKEGRQKEFFYRTLDQFYPELIPDYDRIYRGDKWGNPDSGYYHNIQKTFNRVMEQYRIPPRIPPRLYADVLDENDRVTVMLDHIDYFLKCRGQKSSHGYAAYCISQLKEPLSGMEDRLRSLRGVDESTERIILEILDTGTSSYLEKQNA